MDTSLVKVTCNWSRISGCEFSQALTLKTADPDVFVRPTLDELVSEENAILLSRDQCRDHCELLVQLYPHYKIQSCSLVCNVNKVEVFQGILKEYLETVYGVLEDGCDDEQFKSYRYDIEVEKSGITDLSIKFLTYSEVCLFGIVLQTAPNPNGITTLLPTVQNLLQTTALNQSPASKKCKQFLELMTKANPPPLQKFTDNVSKNQLPGLQKDTLQHRNISELKNIGTIDEDVGANSSTNIKDKEFDNITVRNYIDSNFRQMEERLNHRLKLMEERQMEKFDCILKMLEKLDSN